MYEPTKLTTPPPNSNEDEQDDSFCPSSGDDEVLESGKRREPKRLSFTDSNSSPPKRRMSGGDVEGSPRMSPERDAITQRYPLRARYQLVNDGEIPGTSARTPSPTPFEIDESNKLNPYGFTVELIDQMLDARELILTLPTSRVTHPSPMWSAGLRMVAFPDGYAVTNWYRCFWCGHTWNCSLTKAMQTYRSMCLAT